MLAALAVLAAEPLAARSQAGADRLACEGIVSRATTGLGMLAVEQAVRIEGPGVELLVALLRRPGGREVQAALLGIEHQDTGGALVDCGLTPPAPVSEARELLDGVDGAAAPRPIAADELAARVLAAARRTVEAEIALGHEAGPALPIISRALTGDPTGLPRPAVLAPWEADDPELTVDAAEDEEGFQRVLDKLLDELEEHAKATHPPDGVVWQHGDFVASSMLQWKGGYDDGRLGRWTRADLAEYLLDYFPRKVSVEEETLSAIPECVRAFLGFLDARGSLSGEPLEQLEQACEELCDEFHERVRDSSQWGLAKSMVMQDAGRGNRPRGARRARRLDDGLQRPTARAARRDHRPRRRPHGPSRGAAPNQRIAHTQTAARPAPQGAARRAQAQPATLRSRTSPPSTPAGQAHIDRQARAGRIATHRPPQLPLTETPNFCSDTRQTRGGGVATVCDDRRGRGLVSAGDAAQPQEDPASRSSFNRLAGLEGTYAVAVTGSGSYQRLWDATGLPPVPLPSRLRRSHGARACSAPSSSSRVTRPQRTVARTDEGALDLCKRSALHAPIISVGGYAE